MRPAIHVGGVRSQVESWIEYQDLFARSKRVFGRSRFSIVSLSPGELFDMQQLVPYPQKESEFEVQSELYQRLKNEGFHVRGEVRSMFQEPNGATDRRCQVRFDIVVYDTLRSAVVIIECKNSKEPMVKLGSRQQYRYSRFGVPVLLCSNSAEIERTVESVKEISDALEPA